MRVTAPDYSPDLFMEGWVLHVPCLPLPLAVFALLSLLRSETDLVAYKNITTLHCSRIFSTLHVRRSDPSKSSSLPDVTSVPQGDLPWKTPFVAEPDQHLHREPGARRRAHVPLRRPLHAAPLLHGPVGLRGRPLQDIPLVTGKSAYMDEKGGGPGVDREDT